MTVSCGRQTGTAKKSAIPELLNGPMSMGNLLMLSETQFPHLEAGLMLSLSFHCPEGLT